MTSQRNPLGYMDSRNLGEAPRHECDGMCEKCPKIRWCAFLSAERIRASGYKDSGDDRFNARINSVANYRNAYDDRNNKNYGFSNPFRNYSASGEYNPKDYMKDFGISRGFHGSYDSDRKGGDYSKMMPKAQKSNYNCGSCKGR